MMILSFSIYAGFQTKQSSKIQCSRGNVVVQYCTGSCSFYNTTFIAIYCTLYTDQIFLAYELFFKYFHLFFYKRNINKIYEIVIIKSNLTKIYTKQNINFVKKLTLK